MTAHFTAVRCCRTRCECDELPCPLLSWLSAELRRVCPELRDSVGTGNVLLVGELRTLLSDMFSPLTVLMSEVLDPSVLNKVTVYNRSVYVRDPPEAEAQILCEPPPDCSHRESSRRML